MMAGLIPGDWAMRAALAAVDPETGKDPEWGKAAPAGLLIWVILGVALFLLIKSMNRHMRKVPASFDADAQADGPVDVEATPVASGGTPADADVPDGAAGPDAEPDDATGVIPGGATDAR